MATPARECTELVLVTSHATFTGTRDSNLLAEDQWLLQPFQKSDAATNKPGEHETFIAHILAGAFAAAGRPKALLVFSGGRTAHAERTEAEGCEQVYLGLGEPFDLTQRYALENHATDSHQNLLFSILRFRQVTGRYPEQVTVITHAFKEARFLDLHAPAIGWPAHRIRVQGLNPPSTQAELQETIRGEQERAYKLFAEDPDGVYPPLVDKRRARNFDPDGVERQFDDLEPQVFQLLQDLSGRSLPPNFIQVGSRERLPWDET